jgi:hypothetical protein
MVDTALPNLAKQRNGFAQHAQLVLVLFLLQKIQKTGCTGIREQHEHEAKASATHVALSRNA